MKIGDWVLVPVNGGTMTKGKIIAIRDNIVTVSSESELKICAEAARNPVGVGFKRHLIVELSKPAVTA